MKKNTVVHSYRLKFPTLGLGKNKDGISKHIKVVKRDIGEGLGVKEAQETASLEAEGGGGEWWQNGFNAAVFTKKSKSKDRESESKKKRRKEMTRAEEHPSLEDLFKATGGKRMGMRARMDQSGKFKRTEEEYISNKKIKIII